MSLILRLQKLQLARVLLPKVPLQQRTTSRRLQLELSLRKKKNQNVSFLNLSNMSTMKSGRSSFTSRATASFTLHVTTSLKVLANVMKRKSPSLLSNAPRTEMWHRKLLRAKFKLVMSTKKPGKNSSKRFSQTWKKIALNSKRR